MFAVIRTGGKQHKVAKGDRIKVEKLAGDVGADVKLDEVLMLGGDKTVIGTPAVKGASVSAKIVTQDKHARVRTGRKRKRKGYHKITGHRQTFTELEITGIEG